MELVIQVIFKTTYSMVRAAIPIATTANGKVYSLKVASTPKFKNGLKSKNNFKTRSKFTRKRSNLSLLVSVKLSPNPTKKPSRTT